MKITVEIEVEIPEAYDSRGWKYLAVNGNGEIWVHSEEPTREEEVYGVWRSGDYFRRVRVTNWKDSLQQLSEPGV